MYTRRNLLFAIIAAGSSVLLAQEASAQVGGDVKTPLTLTAAALQQMPRASLKTTSNGMETVYEGVWLHEVLKAAGVIRSLQLPVKVLGDGDLTKKLTVRVPRASASARAKIEAVGGTLETETPAAAEGSEA